MVHSFRRRSCPSIAYWFRSRLKLKWECPRNVSYQLLIVRTHLFTVPIKANEFTEEVGNVLDEKVVDYINGYVFGNVLIDIGSKCRTTL